MIGIDLATTNCGICWMQKDEDCKFATVGMKDLEKKTILAFAKSLSILTYEHDVVVDFSFAECFLPNRRKHVAVKYFLAGCIQNSARNTVFVTPSELREFLGYSKKVSKKTIHQLQFNLEWLEKYTEHELDAYLLALLGTMQKDR